MGKPARGYLLAESAKELSRLLGFEHHYFEDADTVDEAIRALAGKIALYVADRQRVRANSKRKLLLLDDLHTEDERMPVRRDVVATGEFGLLQSCLP